MGKSISKFTIDTGITFASRILQLALGVGVSVIIARVLGPHGKGVFALAFLLPQLLATFGNLGISQASIFYIGRKKYPAEEILGSSIVLSFFLGCLVWLIGLMIVWFFGDSVFPNVSKMYLFLALSLVPFRFLLNSVRNIFLGLQRIKHYNFIGIFATFMLLVFVLVFLLILKLGVGAAITAEVLSVFFTMIITFYLAKRMVGRLYLCFNRSYVKDAITYGFKIYLGNIIGFLHYRIDMFLVNIFLNPLAVGLYSIAVGLTEKIWLISKSAGTVLFPRVSSETNEKRLKEFTPLVCRNILLITFMGAILLFLLGRLLIVLFYSEKFSASVRPFQILLIGAVTMSGWRVLGNDLYGRGKPELNIYISGMSVVLNIVLNVLWIPKFGIVGAAWATSVSYTLAFAVIAVVYAKISGNTILKVIVPQKSDFHLYVNLLKKVI